ncbi:hypothetical protein SMICM304S_11854 [Streptomyces microflavus]
MRAKSRAPKLMQALQAYGINSHLVGVNTSVDTVFVPGSVALAHIYRAKGNEAPMVYVVDAQKAASSHNPVTQRNTLFTAITRSRAWVRIAGWGADMDLISTEAEAVQSANFQLSFRIPSAQKLAKLRHIYKDRTGVTKESVKRATQGLQAFIDAFEKDEIELHDLPLSLRTRLVARMQEEFTGDDD